MSKPEYDPMFQVVVPIGLLDDVLAPHIEAGKGQEPADVCKHCNAIQIIDEVKRGYGLASDQYSKIQAAAAFRN